MIKASIVCFNRKTDSWSWELRWVAPADVVGFTLNIQHIRQCSNYKYIFLETFYYDEIILISIDNVATTIRRSRLCMHRSRSKPKITFVSVEYTSSMLRQFYPRMDRPADFVIVRSNFKLNNNYEVKFIMITVF